MENMPWWAQIAIVICHIPLPSQPQAQKLPCGLWACGSPTQIPSPSPSFVLHTVPCYFFLCSLSCDNRPSYRWTLFSFLFLIRATLWNCSDPPKDKRKGRSDRHDGPAVLSQVVCGVQNNPKRGLFLLTCPVALVLWAGHTCLVVDV